MCRPHLLFFFFSSYGDHRDLHSFPTRRSSDLGGWRRPACRRPPRRVHGRRRLRTGDRKSTRLNSSHLGISYAVFCLKKKKKLQIDFGQMATPTSVQTAISAVHSDCTDLLTTMH